MAVHGAKMLVLITLLSGFAVSCGTSSDGSADDGLATSPVRIATVQVIYTWDLADPRFQLGPGKVVYRKLDGVQRWDAIHQGFENPLTGTVWIVSAGGSEHCLWVRTSAGSDYATSLCNTNALDDETGVIPAIQSALQSKREAVRGEPIIAGQSARCSRIQGISNSKICVDQSSGVLLSLELPHPRTGIMQRITADQVSKVSVASLDVPGERRTSFPVAQLHLPDAVTFP
jgi:hypothetical protein